MQLKFNPEAYVIVYHKAKDAHYAVKKETAPPLPWAKLSEETVVDCILIGGSGYLLSEENHTYQFSIGELSDVWIRE